MLLLHSSTTLSFVLVNLFLEVRGVCDPGWTLYGANCYLVDFSSSTWTSASSDCNGHGAYLVNINDAQENTFIKNLVYSANGGYATIWIDGTDAANEGTWRFSQTNGIMTFTDWGPSQPNGGTSGNCLGMWASFSMRWDDNICSRYRAFVCEKEYPTTTTETATTVAETTTSAETTTTTETTTSAETTTSVETTTFKETTTTAETTTFKDTTTTADTTTAADTTTSEETTTSETTISEESTIRDTTTTFIETTSPTETLNATNSVCIDTFLCSCEQTTMTTQELEIEIQRIKDELTIEKKSTSKAKRKLFSAHDKRPSAQAVGFTGICIICVTVGLFVIADLQRLFQSCESN